MLKVPAGPVTDESSLLGLQIASFPCVLIWWRKRKRDRDRDRQRGGGERYLFGVSSFIRY